MDAFAAQTGTSESVSIGRSLSQASALLRCGRCPVMAYPPAEVEGGAVNPSVQDAANVSHNADKRAVTARATIIWRAKVVGVIDQSHEDHKSARQCPPEPEMYHYAMCQRPQ